MNGPLRVFQKSEEYYRHNRIITWFSFTAGVDTVGNSLIYAIYLISLDERVQTKLRQELEEVDLITPEVLQNLNYLKACIKESFRLYPTASQIARYGFS